MRTFPGKMKWTGAKHSEPLPDSKFYNSTHLLKNVRAYRLGFAAAMLIDVILIAGIVYYSLMVVL
jgi:hypothetical protein